MMNKPSDSPLAAACASICGGKTAWSAEDRAVALMAQRLMKGPVTFFHYGKEITMDTYEDYRMHVMNACEDYPTHVMDAREDVPP